MKCDVVQPCRYRPTFRAVLSFCITIETEAQVLRKISIYSSSHRVRYGILYSHRCEILNIQNKDK